MGRKNIFLLLTVIFETIAIFLLLNGSYRLAGLIFLLLGLILLIVGIAVKNNRK
jgi:hypothetical protein